MNSGLNKKTVRAGIVGARFAATFHFEALRRVYGTAVDIRGVYSLHPESRQSFAEQRGIRAFDSLEQLLDDVDVVHVCAPAAVHESIAIAALERDKFAIVEKPLTGYFGDGSEDFHADSVPKKQMLGGAIASIERMLEADLREGLAQRLA